MLSGEREEAEAIARDWATRELAASPVPSFASLGSIVERLANEVFPDDDADELGVTTQRHNASDEALARPAPGNPILLVLTEGEEEQVVGHRQFDCPSYDGCLDYAAVRNWPSFSCKACPGPGCKP